ncbi:hypothetical protein F0562_002213 [Nyssa sinensis]|uniref:Ionotropic glutamate receptor C-terminal domain-containing protein n=1 Tax=Nyssa sinensis TaxID=561372 RepID=A0A5J5C5N0_9ASTE|nr:hypothetical protein F0562_002213 [Nyssa sinensis]
MSGKKLRIGVPLKQGFKEFVNVDIHPQTNATIVTGFCIDVFKTAIDALEYEVSYEFIPFVNANGQKAGNYNDLIYQVYLQNYDAVVGDITITSNRSLYVDFTLPYTEMGVGTVAPVVENKNMWIFLKPLDSGLWITSASFFIITGFVVWAIEHPINEEFQGSPAQQIGTALWFGFSTLVYAHREKLSSNLSRFVVIVWVFVVLILTSSYTVTLTSLLTVQQIQLASKRNYIGYQTGPVMLGVIRSSNLNFEGHKQYSSLDEYADALSRGNNNGGVVAIIDEIPYIKLFLAKHPVGYAMIASEPTTNGFAFLIHFIVVIFSRALAHHCLTTRESTPVSIHARDMIVYKRALCRCHVICSSKQVFLSSSVFCWHMLAGCKDLVEKTVIYLDADSFEV